MNQKPVIHISLKRRLKAFVFLIAGFCSMLFIFPFFAPLSYAKTIHADNNDNLQELIDTANNGDIIVLENGEYHGNLSINQAITLTSKTTRGAQIIGDKKGSTVLVNADDVQIEALVIKNSGLDLSKQDSGIFVNKGTKNTIITNNLIEDNLIGVYLWGSIQSQVRQNHIIGQKFKRVNDRGNGVQVWASPGSIVDGNLIEYGRDGIFTTTSKNNQFTNNYFRHLRYSVHYMYTQNSEVSHNYSSNNEIGYALMFSDYLIVKDNVSFQDKEHGIFSNFVNQTVIEDNVVVGPTNKCIMLYNANSNTVTNNHFERCHIGIHYTAGSKGNDIYQNNFINNYNQVKYVGTSIYEFSFEEQGNFWSDHVTYDLNKDNKADLVYQPNSISEQILWANTNTKVLFNSPVIQLLKISQSYFPALMPGGVQDNYALITPIDSKEDSILDKQAPFDYKTTNKSKTP